RARLRCRARPLLRADLTPRSGAARFGDSPISLQNGWPIDHREGRGGVATHKQVLEVEYGSARDFAQDFRANLSSGGVFVATQRTFALRDFVVVRLRLPWCNRMIDLEGEVVHLVPAEMASMGARPGVAVQFREPPAGIRGRLAPLCADQAPPPAPPPAADEHRIALRKSVRVAVRLDTASGVVRGRTRNLSHSGVLVDVHEGTAAVGERARVVLGHPSSR